MRILKKSLAVFFCFALLAMTLAAYSQSPESILDSINAGRKPEKLFTHFDKAFYQPGETIWFKTYIVIDGRPGILSTVAKAELISENGSVIASQIIPVAVGSASGSLSLPANLAYGTYVFRLYTQQMLTMKSQDFYYRPIPVLSSAADFNKAVPATDISLRLYIEGGGAFLAGELNILAFKATDQLDRPVQVSGVIKDKMGKDIASFTSEYNGMGKIEMTPKSGEQYTAQYTLPSGTTRSMLLPAIEDEGTNLLIVDEVLKKRLIVSSKFPKSIQQKPSYVLGEMDQTVIFKIDISKSNGHFMGRVPVQDLPGGLLHVAVFNANNEVLAERTCFVNSRKEVIDASLLPVTTGLGKRTENNFSFSLPDSLEGTFSISVTDAAQTQWPLLVNENIISATLVTSSLAPSASNPFYDFGPLTGLEKNDPIDLLLLTNEYKWNWRTLTQLAATKLPTSSEDFIPLRGKAFADRGNKPALGGADLAFIVETKDSAVNSFVARTNESGYFEVEGLFYEDTAQVYVKNNSDKNRDKKVQLEITSVPLSQKYNLAVGDNTGKQVPSFLKTSEQLKAKPVLPVTPIDFDTTVVVLEELVVTSKTKNPTRLLEEKYVTGLFSSSARSTIDFVNDRPNYLGGNIFDYLKGRYSYMQVMGNFPNYSLVYRNMRSLGNGAFIPMALFLDEMVVDASMLSSVPIRDIALVRIYTSGIMGTGGALAVYTKRGDKGASNNMYENTNKFSLPGFSKTTPFYSPDYKNPKKLNIKNDNRKTLYWNSSLTFLPEDGKVPVSFFNNDTCKEYKIVLQGFTTDGKLIYMERKVQ